MHASPQTTVSLKMRLLLLLLSTLALFATTAVVGSSQPAEAQGCSYSAGVVDCWGWTFEYDLSSSSVSPTGLNTRNLEFDGNSMLYRAHFASLPVKYDNDACGPYVDLFSTVTNSDPTGVQGGTFQQNGVNWLELGTHYQIGSYVLYNAFYFSANGEMQMRMFARGLQCNEHHIHYPMFVVDTDVEGETTFGADGNAYHGVGDEVYYRDGNDWVQQTTETDNDVSSVGHDFIVRDPDSGVTVSIDYDDGIFAPPTGDTFDPQAAINNRVYTRQSNGAAELAWPGSSPGRPFLSGAGGFNGGNWGYNDGEALDDPVIVVRGYLDHAVSPGLPDDWHTSGISVKFIDDPLAEEAPTPTPTPTPDNGGPGPDSVLENGVPVSGISAPQGQELRYVFDVPADASSYTVQMTGNGDADLYTQMGSEPTVDSYDCRPYEGGSNEICTGAVPPSGQLHVMVRAYTAIANVELTASYEDGGGQVPTPTPTPTPTVEGPTPTPTPTPEEPGAGNVLTSGIPVTGLSADQQDELYYTFDVPDGATSYTVQIAGNGDADLHTRTTTAAPSREAAAKPAPVTFPHRASSASWCTPTRPSPTFRLPPPSTVSPEAQRQRQRLRQRCRLQRRPQPQRCLVQRRPQPQRCLVQRQPLPLPQTYLQAATCSPTAFP